MRPECGAADPVPGPQKIRILHLITSLDVGGAEAMLEKLVTSMASDRFETMVVSLLREGAIGRRLSDGGVQVRSLNIKRGGLDPLALFRLLRLLREFQPDILQTWLYHADILGTLASRLRSVPHLAWNIRCSEVDFSRYATLTRRIVKLLALLSRRPELIIANSEAGRIAHVRAGYRATRWEIIPNGFDLRRFKPDPEARAAFRGRIGVGEETVLIGLPARADPMKDHRSFLMAARQVIDAGAAVRFLLVGRGTDPGNSFIQGLLADSGLTTEVILLGEQGKMESIFAGLDIVVLASSFGEGFPNVLGEAMACGIPCIATDVGDAAAIVGENGMTVAPRDPTALAAAMVKMASMPASARRQMGMAARARVEEEFSIERVVERYEATYRALAAGRPLAALPT